MHSKTSRLSIFSWCLYDWANSAFITVIGTFIFSVYFARGIVGNETYGSTLWGYAVSASGIVIALLSPILGSIADKSGRRKIWLFIFIQLTILCTILLAFAEPSISFIYYTLITFFFANIAFEMANVFYNAMLSDIAPPEKIGRISGLAWGLGYLGGLGCLITALFVLVGFGDIPPLLEFPTENSAHIRASAILVGMWMGIFSIPILLFCHDKKHSPISARKAIGEGLAELCHTIKDVRHHKNVVRFLIASALFRDGMVTLFAIGGLYASGTFGMGFKDMLIFAIGLNVTSGIGAALFAFVDDKIGSKKTVIIALIGLLVTGTPLLLVSSKMMFMILALALGIFIGPAQAASRTLMARISPDDKQGEYFGLYAFTGKSIAFVGPFLFATLTQITNSQRIGMTSIIALFTLGLIIMLKVREEKE